MEKTFLDYFHLPSDLALWLTLSGSNYPCLEQISMVPKIFEPWKFECILFMVSLENVYFIFLNYEICFDADCKILSIWQVRHDNF